MLLLTSILCQVPFFRLVFRSCSRHLDLPCWRLSGSVREDHVAKEHPGNAPQAEKDKVEELTDRVDRHWHERKKPISSGVHACQPVNCFPRRVVMPRRSKKMPMR